MALYLKYRPKEFDEVYGNEQTLETLQELLAKPNPPHSYLLHGPTGCGKTTLARIIARKLGCEGNDFRELDTADFRGIDTIREIREHMQYRPLQGKCRVWLLDECFAQGTKIKMGDGTEKPIENVKVGDVVQNFIGFGTVKYTFQNIVLLDRVVRVDFDNGQSVICSKDHLFMTNIGWKKAIDLTQQDLLLSPRYSIILDKSLQQGVKNEKEDETSKENLSLLWEGTEKKSEKVLQQDMLQSGYSEAGKEGNSDMCDLRKGIRGRVVFPKTNLLQRVWKQASGTEKDGKTPQQRDQRENISGKETTQVYQPRALLQTLQNEFRADEEEQSDGRPKEYRENESYKKGQWNFKCLARGERGKWKTDGPSENIGLLSWLRLGNRISNTNRASFLLRRLWLPYELQSGYRQSFFKVSSGSRWQEPPHETGETTGQEERGKVDFVRVESVTVYQRGSNDESFRGIIEDKERNQGFVIFYDLEIDSHPSYIANGVLVHNCHKLTNEAQNALLKALEDTPHHVYFILCTTDPHKLLPTIRGRCSEFSVKPLSDRDMKSLLHKVVKAEGERLNKKVYDQIIQDSQGHPRNALQILEQTLAVPPERRLEVAKRVAEKQSQTIQLCRALLNGSPWSKVMQILKGLKKEDPEGVRRAVLGYCQAVLLNGENNQAGVVMEEFIEPFYNSGFAGLVFACYSVVMGGGS